MKKIILSMLVISLLLLSCNNELIEFQEENLIESQENSSVSFSKSTSKTLVNCEPDLDALELNLPQTVSVFAKQAECIEGGGSFAALDIDNGYLAGSNIPAWCADLEGLLTSDTFSYDVYSSYEDVSGLEQSPGVPLFENPNDFDRINWLLNQDIIGTESPNGGIYTFGHLQWAIWEIIEGTGNNCTDDCDFLSCDPIDQWDNNKSDNERLGLELVVAAAEYGEGFIPQCGQKIAVILASTTQQSLIITIDVPEKEVRISGCETAFAKGNSNDDSICFIDDDAYKFKRWGWNIGPLSEGEYTYNVYAGAGQCDVSKGSLVGTVTVNYSDGNVDVTYNIDDGYVLKETHVYAGNDKYPANKKGKPTVAPGKYTIQDNLTGNIYVIAHAVVCK
ncbi:hypothetical protein EYD45_00905 [Hyunsoonleella flava]|uniref:Uncharacterized protein n=1 Tax=Hyunsoonleella flava TaxID=2527939 RepID=A0A4Q9FHP3_9FLAO|nr:hypothetical protein [Hyunsoonleella flava]TBN06472.1 hypothetical protein EYD45_00905 [Hyunsoonleella flava]